MRRATGTRVSVLLGTAAAVAALSSPQALAADATGTNEKISTKKAAASFHHKGDITRVKDKAKDGLGARAYIQFKYKGSWYTGWTSAAGKGKTNSLNLNIPEGRKVYLTLCYTNKGKDTTCSKPQAAHA